MSVLELAAIFCSLAGVYLLVGQPDSARRIQIGAKSVPVLFGAGALLAALGVLLLLCVGTWPAEWWQWENSRLASERTHDGSSSPITLWLENPEFWLAAVFAIGGAAGVVVARSASSFRMSAAIAAFASGVLLGVASDWIGAAALTTIGLTFAWRIFNSSATEPEKPATIEASEAEASFEQTLRGEPLLATTICVLLAWGLVRGLHHSATSESGPAVASSDAEPALPRPVREETRRANAQREGRSENRQSEGWLLGISVGVILMTGVIGGAIKLSSVARSSRP